MDTTVGVDANMNTTMDTNANEASLLPVVFALYPKAGGASRTNNPQAVGSAAALTQLVSSPILV